MTSYPYPVNGQDPIARARREAARLVTTLADLDAADHYGLDTQRGEHLTRAQAILDGLAVDLRAIADVLAPEPPAMVPEPDWTADGAASAATIAATLQDMTESEARVMDGNR